MVTMIAAPPVTVTAEAIAAYHSDGFHIERGMMPPAEITALREHYMELHRISPIHECYVPERGHVDPLKVYPRMMQPHRWDLKSRQWMLDPRIHAMLSGLMDDEPLACQSMFYYKPPGADGQGFHQDNFYLMAHPGTCHAAWLAVDDTDADNGSLYVIPGSHHSPLATPATGSCTIWGGLIPQPDVTSCVEVRLAAGDCLFFHGSLTHGSQANRSKDRWRRSFICHYIGRNASHEVAALYHPILDMNGNIAPVTAGLLPPPGRLA